MPIVYCDVLLRTGNYNPKRKNTKTDRKLSVKCLLDSGCSATIASKNVVSKIATNTDSEAWQTAAGIFTTVGKSNLKLQLTELSPTAILEDTVHVTDQNLGQYDIIIGRNTLQQLGIDLLFSTSTVSWPERDVELPMKPQEGNCKREHFFIQDPPSVQQSSERLTNILDAKYKKADLDDVTSTIENLNRLEQKQLNRLLTDYESLFDGTLGRWTGDPYKIQLKDNVEPYHAKPFPVPHAYEATLKTEIERLVKIGVLKKVNRSEWAAPSFIIPKKDQTVRFINDFRELNKRIKRMPYPMPKIQDMLLKLEGFTYATSLDLNMGYYHIELHPESKKLCTLVFPWGKYEPQKLPMGLANSPDIFQEKMSNLFQDLEYVRTYIDDLLVITKGDYQDHLTKLGTVLNKLRRAGLKVNAKKSFFAQQQLEYLGYWVTTKHISPLESKVRAIQAIAPPENKKQLRRFIGIVNYYRDAWIRRSHILTPLTQLTGKETKWEWKQEHTDAFNTMKRVISKDTLLQYPDFNEKFEIHTDASDYQLGAVISQKSKPIAFFSRKLNSAQRNMTVTEKELLAIVETLKEFRNILLGHDITVYTDHKNLTYKVFNTQRVMRWRLIIEEFSPTLVYLKGEHNPVADALSRLHLEPTPRSECDDTVLETPSTRKLAEAFPIEEEDVPQWSLPISFKLLYKEQLKDKDLKNKVKSNSDYSIDTFSKDSQTVRQLITYQGKICVPKSLQERMVNWYHEMLVHPGETRTHETIAQHFYWANMRKTVHKVVKTCDLCQRTKRRTAHNSKLGKLPPKQAEVIPWETLCVDLIGPYTIKRQGKKKPISLWAMTMIDPATGLLEIAEIKTKSADVVANVAETTWFTRYPWPEKVINDRGTEFMAEFKTMIKEDYNVKHKLITTRNPASNAIIERVHQTIGNMIRSFQVQDIEVTDEFSWTGILQAVSFAIRSTVHTTLRATPMQLVFGRDAILPVRHVADWKYIHSRKQASINKNNLKENKSRKPYDYQVGQKVLLKNKQTTKFGTDTYGGTYTIQSVHADNGTVKMVKGNVVDTFNIRNIVPYYDHSNFNN